MSYTPALPTISDTIWTDNSNFYYIRQDQISATGALVTTWFDAATGQITFPSPTVYPVGNNATTTIIRDYFDVIVQGQYSIYAVGDVLLRLSIFDPTKNTITVTSWLNMTTMTILIVQYWPSTPYTTIVSRDLPIVRGRTTAPASTIISNTTETVILPANGSLYTDIRSLLLSNTSATAVRVDIRDAATVSITGGTGGVSSTTLAVTAVTSTVAPTANVIVPGMVITGTGVTAGATILPYGTNSTTGVGGVGTYAISLASTITTATSLTGTKPVGPSLIIQPTSTLPLIFPIDAKLLQSTISSAWTATLSAAVTDVRITAIGNPIRY